MSAIRSKLTRAFKSWMGSEPLGDQFWTFFVAAFFFDFGFGMFFFLLNLYLLDFGYNEKSLGIITGVMTGGVLSGTLLIGYLARKIGLRRTMLIAFLGAPVIGGMRAIFVHETAQLVLAFAAGVTMCSWTVCFSPVLAKLTNEKNRAFAFSLIFSTSVACGALGGIIAGYIPSWLPNLGIHMSVTAAKRAILLLACSIAAMGVLPAWKLEISAVVASRRRAWTVHPFLLRFLPAVAVWSLVLGSFTPLANVYFVHEFKIPLSRIGLIFSLSQVMQLIAGLVAPLVFRKFGIGVGIMYMQIATAVSLCLLSRAHSPYAAVAFFLAFIGVQWMSSPGIYSLLMNSLPDDERSTASALQNFVTCVSLAAASVLGGISFARFGYPPVLLGIAAIAVLSALLFRGLLSPAAREAAPGAAPLIAPH